MGCNEIVLTIIQLITSCGTIVALATLIYQWRRDLSKDTKEQASKVCSWIDNSRDMYRITDCVYDECIIISNESKQPIYDVRISIQMVFEKDIDNSHKSEYEYIQCIPPGSFRLFKSNTYQGMSKIFNAAISFRDSNGIYWERNASGKLRKLNNKEFDCFINRPEVQADFERVII